MPNAYMAPAAASGPAIGNFARNAPYARPGNYTTPLSPEDEAAFQGWVKANRIPFDPSDPASDYDMRGYFKDVVKRGASETATNVNDGQTHYPDTYKTPYHQSFSNESKYALPTAPAWANDHQLVDPKTGQVVFDERAQQRR